MIICGRCNAENAGDAAFCESCGGFLEWLGQQPKTSRARSAGRTKTATSARGKATRRRPAATATPVPHGDTEPVRRQRSSSRRRRDADRVAVTVALSRPSLAVDAGGEASCEIRVRNAGVIVDGYSIQVLGEHASWVTADPATVNVYPGETEEARITVRPPREPSARSGTMPFVIRVTSNEDPGVFAEAVLAVDIAPFRQLAGELVPQTSTGWRRGEHAVTVRNDGNVEANLSVAASDPERALAFTFDPATFTLAPGAAGESKIHVRTEKWIWLGARRTHTFQVSATDPQAEVGVQGAAQLVQKPIVPRWVRRVAMVVVPVLAILTVAALRTDVVPDVANLPADRALSLIEARGFEVETVNEASEDVPANRAIRTDPDGRVTRGSPVKLFVSAGPNPIAVPNVLGLGAKVANNQLLAAGFVVEPAARKSDAPRGEVLFTDPPANTPLPKGATVTLGISAGKKGKGKLPPLRKKPPKKDPNGPKVVAGGPTGPEDPKPDTPTDTKEDPKPNDDPPTADPRPTPKPGRLELFAIGADTNLYRAAQRSPGRGWGEWSSLQGNIRALEVARNKDGRLHAFVIGSDGALWHKWQLKAGGDEWSSWASLSGGMTKIAVAQNRDGRLEVFVLGGGGTLWHIAQQSPGGAWGDWVGQGGNFSDLAVVTNRDGRIEVFLADAGQERIVHTWQVTPGGAGGWSGFQTVANVTTRNVEAAVDAAGRVQVFFLQGAGVSTMRQARAGDPSAYTNDAFIAASVNDFRVGRNRDGRLEVFAIDRNGHMSIVFQTSPGSTKWSPSSPRGGGGITDVAVALNADGRLEVFTVSSDQTIRSRRQMSPGSSSSWRGWRKLGTGYTQIDVAINSA